ncbi:MAG: CarD family transcriptional regulator [Negativicutes bacterium]|nr:CarD family transcriptional regulator [Negativicutes bacterium]
MLAVGDRVVYPSYGAGVIEAIEEHTVLGERHNYYVLTIPYGGMKVMIPLEKVESVGLREVITEVDIPRVVEILRTPPSQYNVSWNRRFHLNMAKVKSGSIFEVAEVVRNLTLQDRVKRLSTGERRLLETARQILISELVLVCGKDVHSTEMWINGLFLEDTQGN